MLNLAVVLEDSARTMPDRDAIVLGDSRLTYAELDAAAAQVAHLLSELSIGRGDKVALSCPNVPYFPIVYYGILKAGATVVPLNVLLKAREIADHLQDSGAKAYFCFEGTGELPLGREGWAAYQETASCAEFFLLTTEPTAASSSIPGARTLGSAVAGRPAAFDAAPTEPTETAVILYTSGTTGRAKGAELSHSNMLMNALTCHRLFGADPHDVHLVTLPLFHSFGQTVQMNAGLGAGATLVLLPRFDARAAVETMAAESVTFFAGVPTMYWGMLRAGLDESDIAPVRKSLRMAVSGGASLPVEIHREFEEQFGVTILEGYGLSETSPVALFNRRGDTPRVRRGPGLGRADTADRRRVERRTGGRGRRDRDPRAQRHEGLPRPARGHRTGAQRRLAADR